VLVGELSISREKCRVGDSSCGDSGTECHFAKPVEYALGWISKGSAAVDFVDIAVNEALSEHVTGVCTSRWTTVAVGEYGYLFVELRHEITRPIL
jgi:hypothetical protein